MLMLICILTKNVITSCSVTMMLFLHLEVKPLMTLTTVLYLSCALISGHLAMMLMELTKRRSEERFSRNAETDLVCRLLLEKKNVRLRAARNEAVTAVGRRVAQAEGAKHVRRHVVQEVVPRRALHHRRDEILGVAHVGESRAGREQQRIVLEDREPVEHRGESTVQEEFLILVMPDAGEETGELPSGDGVALVRERRHVALNRCVEIDLPLLVHECDVGCR